VRFKCGAVINNRFRKNNVENPQVKICENRPFFTPLSFQVTVPVYQAVELLHVDNKILKSSVALLFN
jgi:hypothetical protein